MKPSLYVLEKELASVPVLPGLGHGVHAVKVPLEDLLKSYVVSYSTLLGDAAGGDEAMHSHSSDDEASCSGSEGDEHGAQEQQLDIDVADEDRAKVKKKKRKQAAAIKRDRLGDYDFDDPFIDDDEVAVAYESIFDMINGTEDAENEEPPKKRPQDEDKPPLREFYVYRGEMQVEVVSKLRGKKKSAKASGAGDDAPEEAENPVRAKAKKTKESKKATKEPKEKREKKGKEKNSKSSEQPPLKEEREKKVSTLERILNLEAKLDEPGKPTSSGDSSKGTPEKSKRAVFDYDRIFAELECRLSLEEWKEQAKTIESFDPAKFPSALRDLTGSLVISYLRAAYPHHSHVEESLFEDLGRLVPYSAGSVKKVTFKKILPLFHSEIASKLVSLYESLAKEAQDLHAQAPLSQTASTQEEGETQLQAPSAKLKPRYTETFRQLLYEIVRFEMDSVYIEQSLKNFELDLGTVTPAAAKTPGEMVLRKSIYQKIHKALPAEFQELISTNDISSQYGAQKRKIERKLLKEHGLEPSAAEPGVGEKRRPPPSVLSANEPVVDQPMDVVPPPPKRLDEERPIGSLSLFLFPDANIQPDMPH